MPTLDVRAMPPRVRHETIFEWLDQLVTDLPILDRWDAVVEEFGERAVYDLDGATPATLGELEVAFDESVRR
jgi:hypothetical protein